MRAVPISRIVLLENERVDEELLRSLNNLIKMTQCEQLAYGINQCKSHWGKDEIKKTYYDR